MGVGEALPLLLALAAVVALVAYRIGYRRGARSEGIVWRKAPEHVLRAARAAPLREGRARVRQAVVRGNRRE